jgi:hypothetical protein
VLAEGAKAQRKTRNRLFLNLLRLRAFAVKNFLSYANFKRGLP